MISLGGGGLEGSKGGEGDSNGWPEAGFARTDDEGHALHDVNSVDAAVDIVRPV